MPPARDHARQRVIAESKVRRTGVERGAKRLKQLEEENRQLKHVVAELTLDNRALKRFWPHLPVLVIQVEVAVSSDAPAG
jgi:hypothetical protein